MTLSTLIDKTLDIAERVAVLLFWSVIALGNLFMLYVFYMMI